MKKKKISVSESIHQSIPKTIYVYATSFCNQNCQKCYFRRSNKISRSHLAIESFEKIFEKGELENTEVVLQGGEYTLHPDAIKIAQISSENACRTTILTNGTSPKISEQLLDYADTLTISVDGKEHDSLRGNTGNLNQITHFLHQGYQKQTEIVLQLTIGAENCYYQNLEFVYELAKENNCKFRINIEDSQGLLGSPLGKSYKSFWLEFAKIFSKFADNYDYEIDYIIKEYVSFVISKHLYNIFLPCYSTSLYSTILENGDVLLCQGLPVEEAKIGNIKEKPFLEIFRSAERNRHLLRYCNLCDLSCQRMGDLDVQKIMYNKYEKSLPEMKPLSQ